ncbi:unnamed protein product [Paramecium pentaurelia]|uniref:Uncharacterized protein n=1 Tax=Paramecium pentaurelia TaxID=43138 RepID=A0A8S1U2B3_9CILI|nr:unnamed protein product [Paramecium pentaurelia]
MRSSESNEVCKRVRLNDQNWQVGRFLEEGVEQRFRNLSQTNFVVEYTKDGLIKYIMDGEILRIEKLYEGYNQTEVIKNVEQIKYLRWQGEYGGNQKKVGKWNAFWRGDNLNVGGLYNENGQKQGKWIELFTNFFDSSQIISSGVYKQGKRHGEWTTSLKDQDIACGIYDENGQKNGVWVEIHDKFSNERFITFVGKYINGLKFGRWDTYFQMSFEDEIQLIGGGEYNQNGVKSGFWIDIHEDYDYYEYQIIYLGEYIDGKKYGQWNTQFKDPNFLDQQSFIGGGFYDQNEVKTGKWIELYEDFRNVCQILLEGEYVKGIKQGKWNTQFRLNQHHKFKTIGGGNYDHQGIKNGRWIEMNNNFWKQCQVIESGEYQNGNKIGSWIIKFRYTIKYPFNKIGGGIYDDNGMKNGKWIEIFKNFQNSSQVTLVGDYLNGTKTGRWNIMMRYHEKEKFQFIGGGMFDQQGLKNGDWIELIENFGIQNQVIMRGEYLFGMKLGQWNTLYRNNPKLDFSIIGGGQYDKNGQKIGYWVDLNNYFGNEQFGSLQVLKGTYENGLKKKKFTHNFLHQG